MHGRDEIVDLNAGLIDSQEFIDGRGDPTDVVVPTPEPPDVKLIGDCRCSCGEDGCACGCNHIEPSS